MKQLTLTTHITEASIEELSPSERSLVEAAREATSCAERTACYYAHSRHPDSRFTAIAIAARGTDGEELAQPIAPCGACRQALLEYETLAGRDVKVILTARDKVYILPSVRSTLPLAFSEF